jgi:hypothetical protein
MWLHLVLQEEVDSHTNEDKDEYEDEDYEQEDDDQETGGQ